MSKFTNKKPSPGARRSISMLAGIVSLAGLLNSTQAMAVDRFVDADNGTDTTVCDVQVTPCKTIAYTIGQASSGDTINLISTTGLPVTYRESGITIPFDLTIVGGSSGSSTIDAGSLDRAIDITAGNVLIRNVTIQNGDAGTGLGGGINLQAGNLIVVGSKVIENEALAGGAIAAHPSAGGVLVIASAITQNRGSANGGGIWCDDCASVNVALSAVSDNLTGGAGGGIAVVNGTINIARTYMKRNNADTGGALHLLNGEAFIATSELSDNEADQFNGGAIMLSGDLTLQWSTLASNTSANEGGAIYVTDGSRLIMSNSTVSNNDALVGGGFSLNQAFFTGPDVVVGASTFYNNTSSFFGAAEHFFGTWNTFVMNNSIVANDPAAAIVPADICSTTLTGGSYNLIDDASCSTPALLFNLGAVNGLDLNLSFNGGMTRTHELLAGSNAIDAGLAATCVNPSTGAPLVIDQRRQTRPVDGDLNGVIACDIGAFEIQ